MARAYPEALFAHVNDVAGRDIPCQCAKHNQERQQLLERIMFLDGALIVPFESFFHP
jgi:hypothetical protein